MKLNDLVTKYIDPNTGLLSSSAYDLNAGSDMYYEYLLKQWIQAGSKFDSNDLNYFLLDGCYSLFYVLKWLILIFP